MTNDIKDTDLENLDNETLSEDTLAPLDENSETFPDIENPDADAGFSDAEFSDGAFEDDDFDTDGFVDDDFGDDDFETDSFDGGFEEDFDGHDPVVASGGFDASAFLKKNFHYILIAFIGVCGVWFVLSSLLTPVNDGSFVQQPVEMSNSADFNNDADFSSDNPFASVPAAPVLNLETPATATVSEADNNTTTIVQGSLLGGAKPALKSPQSNPDVSVTDVVTNTAKNINPQTWVQEIEQASADIPPMPSPISRDEAPVFPTMRADRLIPATGSLSAPTENTIAEDAIEDVIDAISEPALTSSATTIVGSSFDQETFKADILKEVGMLVDNRMADDRLAEQLKTLSSSIATLTQNVADIKQAQQDIKNTPVVTTAEVPMAIDQKTLTEGVVSQVSEMMEKRFTTLSDRLDGIEKLASEKAVPVVLAPAEVQKTQASRVETLRAETPTKTITPKVKKSTVVKKPTLRPSIVSKPAIKSSWILRAAQPNAAWVSQTMQSQIQKIAVGDTLNGIGRVTSITNGSDGWVVVGTTGQIKQ